MTSIPHRMALLAFLMAGLVGTMFTSDVAADTKYKACSRLTAAELGAALKPPVSKVQDTDIVVDSGPYKGATVSSCTWRSGLNLVILRIWPAPTTPEQRNVGMKALQQDQDLRQMGYTVVPANLPGAECYTLKPPANLSTLKAHAACTVVTKGVAFWLSVTAPLSVQQVKALADKVRRAPAVKISRRPGRGTPAGQCCHRGARFSRNARMPSWASGATAFS